MDWSGLGRTIAGQGLTLLGGALAGPAGAAVGRMVAGALGVAETATPEEVKREIDRDPTSAATVLRRVEETRSEELARAYLDLEAESLRQVGETARAELAQDDLYVKRCRATLLYGILACIGIMVSTACAVVFVAPDGASALGALYRTLEWPLIVLGSAAGVYIRSRSTHDKPVAAGHAPPAGLLSILAERIGGRR